MRRMLNYQQQQHFTQRYFLSPTQPLRPSSMLCYAATVFLFLLYIICTIITFTQYFCTQFFQYSARESNLVKKDNDNVVVTFCDSHVTYVTFCDSLSLMSHICHVRAIENMVLQKKKLCEFINHHSYVLFIIFYVNYNTLFTTFSQYTFILLFFSKDYYNSQIKSFKKHSFSIFDRY